MLLTLRADGVNSDADSVSSGELWPPRRTLVEGDEDAALAQRYRERASIEADKQGIGALYGRGSTATWNNQNGRSTTQTLKQATSSQALKVAAEPAHARSRGSSSKELRAAAIANALPQDAPSDAAKNLPMATPSSKLISLPEHAVNSGSTQGQDNSPGSSSPASSTGKRRNWSSKDMPTDAPKGKYVGRRGSNRSGGSPKAEGAVGRRGSNRSGGSRGRKTAGTKESNASSGSGRRSRSSRGQRSVSGDSSSDEEQDADTLSNFSLAALPAHLIDSVPLHLRETIVGKGTLTHIADAKVDSSKPTTPNTLMVRKRYTHATQRPASASQRPASASQQQPRQQQQQKASVFELGTAPAETGIIVRRSFLACFVCLFVLWSILVVALLGTYVVRYSLGLRDEMHRFSMDTALLKVEAAASTSLAPAVFIVRTLAMAVHMGILDSTDPLVSISRMAVPEMRVSPDIKHVRLVAGSADRLVILLPGQLHDGAPLQQTREPLVYAVPLSSCQREAPLACLGLDASQLQLGSAPGNAAASWVGPVYLQEGAKGEILSLTDWIFALRFVAQVGVGRVDNRSAAIDVAISLAGLAAATAAARPDGGAVYICTSDGVLLAGSNWQAVPRSDGFGGMIHQRLWDLQLDWLQMLTPAVLAKDRRSELFHGPDLVVVQPLFAQGTGASGGHLGARLRAVAFVPRIKAVRPLLGQLIYSAVSVIAAPLVAVLVVLATLTVVSCCRGTGCWCCPRELN